MADVQGEFRQFHEAIKLTDLDENATLLEKRKLLVTKLRDGLRRTFEELEESAPTFQERNLGSYAMGTGIKPTGGRDFDIDVGLYFNNSVDDYEPVKLKQLVLAELDKAPHSAEMQRPCVTVTYTKDGEDAYHVDFAVLVAGEKQADGVPRLAKGLPGSNVENKVWEPSGSLEFVKRVTNHLDGDDRQQFKRVIRYLKRWKDFRFSARGEGAPRGIGLTAAALLWFVPRCSYDGSGKRVDDDLVATRDLVAAMRANFGSRVHDGEVAERLTVTLPVLPYDDPFSRMSNRQMGVFKERLQALKDTLQDAIEAVDRRAACSALRKQFGDDFPVPDEDSTKSAGPAILTGGHFGG